MLRTVLAPIVLAGACGGGTNAEAPAGPVYSPLIANGLRAIADNCKLERTRDVERRDCTGRFGTVQITLGPGDRFSRLVIALPSKILPEATGHFKAGLTSVLGQAGMAQFTAKLEALQVGDRAELAIDKAKITLTAGGTSKIAPEYTADITW